MNLTKTTQNLSLRALLRGTLLSVTTASIATFGAVPVAYGFVPNYPTLQLPQPLILLPTPAQHDAVEPNNEAGPDEVNERTTSRVVSILEEGGACSSVPIEYQVDCLKELLADAAAQIDFDSVGYDKARRALRSASNQLDQLVRANLDPSAERLNTGRKSLRAVRRSVAAAVNRQARAIVEEAKTKLLRSSGSQQRRSHYTRIAMALDSAKQLLRS